MQHDIVMAVTGTSWGGFFLYRLQTCFADLHLQFYMNCKSTNFFKVSLQTFNKCKKYADLNVQICFNCKSANFMKLVCELFVKVCRLMFKSLQTNFQSLQTNISKVRRLDFLPVFRHVLKTHRLTFSFTQNKRKSPVTEVSRQTMTKVCRLAKRFAD